MAGRRALGIVLAELLDAGILGTRPPFLTYAIGLIDEQLVHIEPQPVEPSTPNPWRSNNSSTFDIRGWCDETQEAAQIYAAASSVTTPYLLAERGEWCSLEWGKPEEIRRICAMHRASPRGDLLLPARRAWEATTAGAHRYPRRLRLDWSHEELVVYGRELSTDARWLEWLALHPAAGFRLGWEPAPDDLFTWRGTDGDWRARTVRRARGQLSHQPSAAAACAEVWQVVLSDTGRTELLAAFPATTRTLALTRTLPANARETRPEDETAVAQVLLSEPS
jgi:hypothetical protein